MPNSVISLDRTPISEWYVLWFSSKSGYQKDLCLTNIGMYVQTMVTILDLNCGDMYDH